LAGALREDGSYDMADWFEPIRESLSSADLMIGNLETSFAGEEEEYAGFPKFNSPDAYADALAGAGFDVLTMANNHTYDNRVAGIERTMEVLDARGVLHTGAYAREEDFDEPLICEVNGVRVGVLAYTDTFNSKPKKDYYVRELNRGQVEKDVAAMREAGADFILSVVHWGDEYEEKPDSSQRHQAEMLAEAGVDAVFGSHPHVVQTAEMLSVEREDGSAVVPVAYSMGNFISNQQDRPRDIGVIFEIKLRKSGETGETSLERAGYVPTVVYRWHEDHRDNYAVLPCGVYKEMDGHEKQRRCRKVWEWMEEEMGEGWEILEK
ncbi:MAG: CapA family protein, partial [Candidatus Spyradocola sp.]